MSKRTYKVSSAKFKFTVALAALQEGRSDAEVARSHNTHSQLVGQWKRQLLKSGQRIFENRRAADSQDRKTAELEKIIGQQTVEIQFLKKILGHLD